MTHAGLFIRIREKKSRDIDYDIAKASVSTKPLSGASE